MALAGSAWKHVSSSGVSTRLGARLAHASGFRPPAALVYECCSPPKCLLARPLRRSDSLPCSFSGVLVSLVSTNTSCYVAGPKAIRHPVLGTPAHVFAVWAAANPSPTQQTIYLQTRHRMRQDYPLNLSISLSGGEETNQDAPSNGE